MKRRAEKRGLTLEEYMAQEASKQHKHASSSAVEQSIEEKLAALESENAKLRKLAALEAENSQLKAALDDRHEGTKRKRPEAREQGSKEQSTCVSTAALAPRSKSSRDVAAWPFVPV